MQIVDLTSDMEKTIQQIAEMLVATFAEKWPLAWPDIESALEEIHDSFPENCISRVALDENEDAMGWIGGLPQYDGNVWELHPLVVHPKLQHKGIGSALVRDFEEQVALRGGLTITLGSDDAGGLTTLSEVNLYENLWEYVQNIHNLNQHPYEFYQKLGFIIVGVVPDANGIGKPDILMAKRVNSAT